MSKISRIPFNRPFLAGNEFKYIQQAINSMHVSGDGIFSKKCHHFLEEALGVRRAMLTTSCTHALEMAALLLDLSVGDEVIVPSFTFVSSINAFVLRGATPVFIDIRPDTLNLDETLLESKITSRTKAIILVHYAGIGCEMDRIMEIASAYGIPVIEDNAHGLFGKYKGRNLGTFGEMATLSFHETKNFSCGEGGALLINNQALIPRAEVIREKGTNRSRFFRGEIDKYTWVDLGSSYLPSDILAAVLYSQLEKHEQIQARRRSIWLNYYESLETWAYRHGVGLPHIPEHCDQTYHIFYLLLPNLEERTALISRLMKEGISAVFHYQPLHISPMGLKFGGRTGDCPVTERISDCLVRLPLFFDFSEDNQQKVLDAVKTYTS